MVEIQDPSVALASLSLNHGDSNSSPSDYESGVTQKASPGCIMLMAPKT